MKSKDEIILGEKVTHFMYADDLVIVASSKEGLQEKLNNLSKFADTKDLTINTKKSIKGQKFSVLKSVPF